MARPITALFAALYGLATLSTISFAAPESFDEDVLLFGEIPVVVTASKKAEPIYKAPSVVYVVTSEEIKRSGARTLGEALKRVPGFHISFRETSILGSRGFTSDQIDKFVWLIDGSPVTNIMQDGPWGFLDMPNMDMVDHIEIVKGPGSTLWGSNASLGIINVITKTGEQVGGVIPSSSFSTRDEQVVGNVLYGGKNDKFDYMFSFTYTKSKGFTDTGSDYNHIYGWGTNDVVNNGFDNYKQDYHTDGNPNPNNRGRSMPLLQMQPAWEMYGKIKYDDISVKTRAAYTRGSYLWGTNLDAQKQDVVFKHMFTEVGKMSRISDETDIETKVGVHTLSYDRGVLVQAIDPLAATDLETKTEMGVNLESILKTTIADKHKIVAGVKLQSVQFGPSQRQQYYVGTESTTLNGGYPNGFKYVYVTDAGLDNTASIYAEDTFSVTDKLALVGGVGYEYNDYVEVGGKVMPRASVNYDISKVWNIKYCYNTGYERPPVDKKFHKMFGHVEKSEDIQESDIQLSFNTEKTRASITAFYYQIFNYFTWIQINDANGNMAGQGHGNMGDGKSDGFEFDVRHNLSRSLSVYGNFTYANTKINNATPVGDPSQLYNAGVDYYATRNISLNLNVNGWLNMPNGFANGAVWSGAGEELVDVALVADNVLNRPLALTLFARNVFDTKSHIGMTGWPGYTYAEGASYGVKLSYKL